MKYKTENEFCIETTKILLGICIYGDSQFLCVPEVPRGFGSNDHTDMLIINMTKKEMIAVEYKLADIKGLRHQLMKQQINSIGIVNREVSEEITHIDIYGYTGKDYEVERLHSKLVKPHCNIPSLSSWTSIYYSGWARFYYYAFKNNKSNLSGGLKNCKRKTFHHYYIQAIRNLQKDYNNKLDFMIVNAVFDVGYSISTARKYYRMAMG